MRRAAIVVGVLVIAAGVLWLAVGDEALGGDDAVVTIESISPAVAMEGTEVVIRGEHFQAEGNDIEFVLGAPSGDFPNGYHQGVPSEDGTTLRFEIPEYLGACTYTKEDDPCLLIALPVPVGKTEVFVVTRNGTSNRLPFERTITKLETTERAIFESGELEDIRQMLSEVNFPWHDIQIRECENGETCVFLEFYELNLDILPRPIPETIAGYEVRLE